MREKRRRIKCSIKKEEKKKGQRGREREKKKERLGERESEKERENNKKYIATCNSKMLVVAPYYRKLLKHLRFGTFDVEHVFVF